MTEEHSQGAATHWRNRDVWAISLSACFADLGYQSVLAVFPLFLVLALRQPVWEYGLATALSYGGGAAFSFIGGRLGDRVGHRRLALFGNSLIPLLSLSALSTSPAVAIGLLTGGWWARNLRSPSRRVMLTEAVPDPRQRNYAFGFLHALDVGGGVLAAIYVLVAVSVHLQYRWIFLATALPLVVSTITLSRARTGAPLRPEPPGPTDQPAKTPLPGARALLAAAALYGFSSYAVGFPVLTVAQGSGRIEAGIAAFLVFQAVSSATGYLVAGRFATGLAERFSSLGWLGYLGAAIGAALLGTAYVEHLGVAILFLAVAILGFALGVVETVEPALMSVLRPGRLAGRGFGALGAARSFGVFAGNLIMGLLYGLNPGIAYTYAAVVGLAAAAVVLGAVPAARGAEARRQ